MIDKEEKVIMISHYVSFLRLKQVMSGNYKIPKVMDTVTGAVTYNQ
jgi:hypothetical protein